MSFDTARTESPVQHTCATLFARCIMTHRLLVIELPRLRSTPSDRATTGTSCPVTYAGIASLALSTRSVQRKPQAFAPAPTAAQTFTLYQSQDHSLSVVVSVCKPSVLGCFATALGAAIYSEQRLGTAVYAQIPAETTSARLPLGLSNRQIAKRQRLVPIAKQSLRLLTQPELIAIYAAP